MLLGPPPDEPWPLPYDPPPPPPAAAAGTPPREYSKYATRPSTTSCSAGGSPGGARTPAEPGKEFSSAVAYSTLGKSMKANPRESPVSCAGRWSNGFHMAARVMVVGVRGRMMEHASSILETCLVGNNSGLLRIPSRDRLHDLTLHGERASAGSESVRRRVQRTMRSKRSRPSDRMKYPIVRRKRFASSTPTRNRRRASRRCAVRWETIRGSAH